MTAFDFDCSESQSNYRKLKMSWQLATFTIKAMITKFVAVEVMKFLIKKKDF